MRLTTSPFENCWSKVTLARGEKRKGKKIAKKNSRLMKIHSDMFQFDDTSKRSIISVLTILALYLLVLVPLGIGSIQVMHRPI